MAYLLDANAFIAAKNLYYGLDFCPAYWSWIEREHGAGHVASVEKVGDELAAGADELSTWAAALPSTFFQQPDPTTLPALAKVRGWVVGRGFSPAARNVFEQGADYFLVAQALAGQHTVVTYEAASGSLKRVKIPDVCIGLGIKCLTPHEMLRAHKARFVL